MSVRVQQISFSGPDLVKARLAKPTPTGRPRRERNPCRSRKWLAFVYSSTEEIIT